MKSVLSTFLLFAAVLLMAGVQVSVERDTVSEGELFDFTIQYSGKLDDGISLPRIADVEWLPNFRQNGTRSDGAQIVNFLSIGARIAKKGSYTIPAFSIRIDGTEEKTQPLSIQVVSPADLPIGAAGRLGDNVFGELSLPGRRTTYYVGETIPLRISVQALSVLRPFPNQFPELSGLEEFVLHSYQWSNGQSSNFAEPTAREIRQGNRTVTRFDFITAARPLKPGKFSLHASMTLPVTLPGKERSSMRLMSQTEQLDYRFELKSPGEIEIKSLPAAPTNAIDLGLIGNWTLKGGFDKTAAKVGEALTFELTLDGDETTTTLNAPKLEFENMRTFPPEIQSETTGKIRILYATVPLKEGNFKKTLTFATFHPESGVYDVHEVALDLPISPSDLPMTPGYSNENPSATNHAPTPGYLPAVPVYRPAAEDAVALPLLWSALPWAIGIVIAAGIPALGIELAARHARRLREDAGYRRRRKLKKETPRVIAQLKAAKSEEEFLNLVSESFLPLLNEAFHLPPGTTPSELIEKVEDPELQELLRACEAAAFMPPATRQPLFSPKTVERLIAGLRKYACLLLLALFFSVPASTTLSAADDREALQRFQQELNNHAPSPDLLYNLGSASAAIEDFAAARGYLERAHRLTPHDKEIEEKLQQVNEALKLPPPSDGMLARVRDQLRPDQYLLISASILAGLILLTAARRKLPRSPLRVAQLILGVAFLLAVAAIGTQMSGPYRPNRAIVLGTSQTLRALPVSSGDGFAEIPGGSDARILDYTGSFVRVDAKGLNGYLPKEQIMPLF